MMTYVRSQNKKHLKKQRYVELRLLLRFVFELENSIFFVSPLKFIDALNLAESHARDDVNFFLIL